jgi:dienelactone hydrolase
MRIRLFWLIPLWACCASRAQQGLPDPQPLFLRGDRSTQVVTGSDKLPARETAQSVGERTNYWHRDFSSVAAYDQSVQPNRERLRKLIGAVDARLPMTALEVPGGTSAPAKIAETDSFTVQTVRWPVFEGVFAEGLWLEPKGDPVACIVAIPDADQTPEILVGLAPGLAPERQFARRLAENGCEVLVPVLIDRQDAWPGNAPIKRFANQPHREWIYRQAVPLGRHVIGYEVQKVLAAVDWFERKNARNTQHPSSVVVLRRVDATRSPRIGVAGYAEGALLAFYAAALDGRIEAAMVSGYFNSRQRLGEEPIYRTVLGLLREFGDAEIASLIAPRALIVEHSVVPNVEGPSAPREGRTGAAPGRLQTPDYESVEAEFERARALLKPGKAKDFDRLKLITATEGLTTGPGSDRALTALLDALGVPVRKLKPPGTIPADSREAFDPGASQQRQIKELEDYTQKLLRE